MSNKRRTVFYTGITNDLQRRMEEHRAGSGSVFTMKYKCHALVYFEACSNAMDAISREKTIKNWRRQWKINLIRDLNPDMNDLAEDW